MLSAVDDAFGKNVEPLYWAKVVFEHEKDKTKESFMIEGVTHAIKEKRSQLEGKKRENRNKESRSKEGTFKIDNLLGNVIDIEP